MDNIIRSFLSGAPNKETSLLNPSIAPKPTRMTTALAVEAK